MGEPFDLDGKVGDSSASHRPRYKPELPIPKIPREDFAAAQRDEKVKRALREAREENEDLEQAGKIHA